MSSDRVLPRPHVLRLLPARGAGLLPLARLVERAEVTSLGGDAAVQLRQGDGIPAPRAVTEIQSWPKARRLMLPVEGARLGLVLLRKDTLEGWQTAPGQGVEIAPGTWHVGPWPVGGGEVLEATEGTGSVDRVDRASLAQRLGISAATVLDPERRIPPRAPARHPLGVFPGLVVEPELRRRLRVGAIEIEAPDLRPPELGILSDDLDALQGPSLDERRLRAEACAAGLGLPHPLGTIRAQALRSLRSGLLPPTTFEAALGRTAVELEVDLMAASIDRVESPYRLRLGRAWEQALRSSGHEMPLGGSWVLDAGQRLLATQEGPLPGGRLGPRTHRVLVLVLLARTSTEADTRDRFQRIAHRLLRLGGGRIVRRGFHG